MRRIFTVGALVMAFAATNASGAGAATYEGHFKGLPDSSLELTFASENGKLYLDGYDYSNVPATCDDGPETFGGLGGYNPPDGRVAHREFKVRSSSPGSPNLFLLAGELRRGKAVGVFRFRANDVPGHTGICDTGKVEWVAQKQ